MYNRASFKNSLLDFDSPDCNAMLTIIDLKCPFILVIRRADERFVDEFDGKFTT
jgi:hypothetical protein